MRFFAVSRGLQTLNGLRWLETDDARPHPNPLPQGEGEQSRFAGKSFNLLAISALESFASNAFDD